ncbi:MAG: hypothetical protein IJW74_03360, partial [Oscillospiraceae bacterium]|nr:hypothetical protein [Oscillospiraceae bacterium]
MKTAKVFLAVTNPVETMEYLKETQKLNGTADNHSASDETFDKAEQNAAYAESMDDNDKKYKENPFENFDIEAATQENGPDIT